MKILRGRVRRDDLIVTGDAALLALGEFEAVRIERLADYPGMG